MGKRRPERVYLMKCPFCKSIQQTFFLYDKKITCTSCFKKFAGKKYLLKVIKA